jgi:hypothetical protein
MLLISQVQFLLILLRNCTARFMYVSWRKQNTRTSTPFVAQRIIIQSSAWSKDGFYNACKLACKFLSAYWCYNAGLRFHENKYIDFLCSLLFTKGARNKCIALRGPVVPFRSSVRTFRLIS